MKSREIIRLTRKIDMLNSLRFYSVVCVIALVIVFFSACATKSDEADSNSIIREGPSGHEVHGEVGAMYGQGTSRR